MTDEQMDERLRAAGARWREAAAAAASTTVLDRDRFDVPRAAGADVRRSKVRGRWLAAGAAAGVAAAAVLIAVVEQPTATSHTQGGVRSGPKVSAASNFVGSWTLLSRTDVSSPRSAWGSAVLGISRDGTLKANDGCNYLSGRLRPDGEHRLRAADYTTTAMACVDPTQSAAAASFDRLLDRPFRWAVHGDRLILTRADGARLTFGATRNTTTARPSSSEQEPGPANLFGAWQVTATDEEHPGSASGSSAVGETKIVLTPRKIMVMDECGHRQTQLSVDPKSLLVGSSWDVHTHSCPAPTPDLAKEQQRIGRVLRGRITWTIKGATLHLERVGVGGIDLTRR
jgi:heat shock protein HslJ